MMQPDTHCSTYALPVDVCSHEVCSNVLSHFEGQRSTMSKTRMTSVFLQHGMSCLLSLRCAPDSAACCCGKLHAVKALCLLTCSCLAVGGQEMASLLAVDVQALVVGYFTVVTSSICTFSCSNLYFQTPLTPKLPTCSQWYVADYHENRWNKQLYAESLCLSSICMQCLHAHAVSTRKTVL